MLKGGHSESVLCVECKEHLLVSGGEGGELCTWDLRSEELTHKLTKSDGCTSICVPKTKPDALYASFGETVEQYDVRNFDSPVDSLPACDDEINQIVLNDKEEFLAACNDAGNVKVFTVRAGENKVFKTLRNKHTNICSSVTFRPGKPWDIVTGGFDYNLIHWDFGRLKALNMWCMQELISDENLDSVNYMLNPPFVHHVNVSPDGTLVACGLGNGGVLLMDSSRRHLKKQHYFQAHSQGVSQVHFIDSTKFITGSNDEQILMWDLSQGENAGEAGIDAPPTTPSMNGHRTNPAPLVPVLAETLICHKIDHKFKINWLKPVTRNGALGVAVTDQRSDITLYAVP